MIDQWYWIIPNKVLFDKKISDKEKLIYIMISSLCAERGYCRANNNYFAERLGITKSRISNWINSLYKRWFITIDIKKDEWNKRFISIAENRNTPIAKNSNTYCRKQQEGIAENSNTPIAENSKHNNINNNSIKEEYNIIPSEIFNFFEKQKDNMVSISYQIKKNKNYINKQAIEYQKLKKEIKDLWDPNIICPAILEFITKDDFWKKNIWSITKLRKKNKDWLKYWIIMIEKMKQSQTKKTKKPLKIY